MSGWAEGKSARNFPCTEEEKELIADCPLLSNKPVIYVANLSEADFAGDLNQNPLYRQVLEIAEAEGSRVVPICGKIEEELSQMESEDRQMFLEELGLHQSGLDRLVTAGYDLLGLDQLFDCRRSRRCVHGPLPREPKRRRRRARSTATLSAALFAPRSSLTKR